MSTPPPVMTVERWRTIDRIVQEALVQPRDRRDAFVANACGRDIVLQTEVASLLAAHDATPADFLERPAMESFERMTLPPAASSKPPGRSVSAQWVVRAAAVTLAIGVVGGWALARSSITQRWTDPEKLRPQPASDQPIAVLAPPAAAITSSDASPLVVVDRDGRIVRAIDADRPWTPRFSPDGRHVAYGAFGSGRQTSDIWITDVDAGTTKRVTDDDGDSNDPQWSPDGHTLAYSVSAPDGKDVVEQRLDGRTPPIVIARPGSQFPSDWLRDGSALLVTEVAGAGGYNIFVQPSDGSSARPYVATDAQETAARISPDGHWVAYTSDESGREEIYVDAYPRARERVMISRAGGAHAVWRGDGRELYYWRGDALVAVQLGASDGSSAPRVETETVLFHAAYDHELNTMYDVSPDGQRFIIVRHGDAKP